MNDTYLKENFEKRLEKLKEKYKTEKQDLRGEKFENKAIIFTKWIIEIFSFLFTITPLIICTQSIALYAQIVWLCISVALATTFITIGAEYLPKINSELYQDKQDIKEKGKMLKALKERINLIEQLIQNNDYAIDDNSKYLLEGLEQQSENNVMEQNNMANYSNTFDYSNVKVPNMTRSRIKK